MHQRFARAPRAEIVCPDGVLEAAVAESFSLRLRGLTGLEPDEVEPLLFPRCRSVHTVGMRTAIDLVWLDQTHEPPKVLKVVEGLPPRRQARAPRDGHSRGAISALELRAGQAGRLGLVVTENARDPRRESSQGP